jgi:hypothetical protein
MEFSEYENIEIFNNTQRFTINKCENQILRSYEAVNSKNKSFRNSLLRLLMIRGLEDKLYI